MWPSLLQKNGCKVTRLEGRGDAGRGQTGVRRGGKKWRALGRMYRVPTKPCVPKERRLAPVFLHCPRGGRLDLGDVIF